MPKPLLNKKSYIILYNMHHTEAECNDEISRYDGITKFTLISLKPSLYCTQEYDTWWRNYYSTKMFNVSAFTQHLANFLFCTRQIQEKYFDSY